MNHRSVKMMMMHVMFISRLFLSVCLGSQSIMHKSLLDVLVMLGVYLYLFLYFQILNYTLQIYTLLVKFVVARDGQILSLSFISRPVGSV